MPKEGANQSVTPGDALTRYRDTLLQLTKQLALGVERSVYFPFDWPETLAALRISDSMFAKDTRAAIRLHRLEKLIRLRAPGQSERAAAVNRIHEISKSPGIPKRAYDGAMRALDVELSSHDELERLERLRARIREAHPLLFGTEAADGH